MYRRGAPRSTPTNVQCQKCLKRDKLPLSHLLKPALTLQARHYSYECKSTLQDRPYIARPSRSQQLRNPKLAPKLTEVAPPELQKKQGIADQELAKLEAERAKKRALERVEEHPDGDPAPRRRRSASYDSVSTVSTRSSPRPGTGSQNPDLAKRTLPGRSDDSDDGHDHNGSSSPNHHHHHRTRSPVRDDDVAVRDDNAAPLDWDQERQRSRRSSSSHSGSPPPSGPRKRYRSRSPERRGRWDQGPPRYRDSRKTGSGHRNRSRPGESGPRREQRDRSLSPFSKRLAMTQAMNMGC